MGEELNLSTESTIIDGIERDLDKEQQERVIPIAKEILKIMAGKDLVLGRKINEKERADCYGAIYKDVIALFKEKNILLQDVNATLAYCSQALQLTKDVIEMSLNRNLESADNILWGTEKENITIEMLDNILKTGKIGK